MSRRRAPRDAWSERSLFRRPCRGDVRGLAVSGGQVHVAVTDEVCSVDLGTGKELARLAIRGASGITCDTTGERLVGTATGVLCRGRTLGDRPVRSVATDANGRRLVVGCLGHEGYDPPAFVEVWDLTTERRLVDLPFEVGTLFVAISPDGARIAAVGESGVCRVWTSDGVLLGERRFRGPVWGVAFSPGGDELAVGPEQTPVVILDPATGALVREISGTHGAWTLAFGPGGALAVGGGSGAAIHREGTVVELRGGFLGVTCLWWLADGSLLGGGTEDVGVREVWRWTPGKLSVP